MYPVWKGIVLLICGCQLASLADIDCPYKGCGCYTTTIYRPGYKLTSMPIRYNKNATGYLTLNLNSNHISEIPAGSLPPGLQELSLINNRITTIEDNAVNETSPTLESLYCPNAQLTRIPDTFLQLDALTSLIIFNATILDWNDAAMTHIGHTLQILKLVEVGLTAWPVWLTDFQHLKELSLASNSISFIPDHAFDKLSYSLLTLTLSNNNFTASPQSLSQLINLTTLDLQNNNISNITWLPLSNKLSSLSLNNNNISDADHLSDVLSSYADSLESLALSFNQLKVIPDLSFLKNLYFLDLANNQISDPDSGSVNSSMGAIDLSFNQLPSIPIIYQDLTSVSIMFLSNNVIQVVRDSDIPIWVTRIELQYNLITDLNDTSFPGNSSLEDLNLDNNPLQTISELAFANLGSLATLSLQYTKLTRLPLSLRDLTSINYIKLNNNPDLVCTCTEKSVDKIAIYVDLNANCGDISIYDFLANLSSDCP